MRKLSTQFRSVPSLALISTATSGSSPQASSSSPFIIPGGDKTNSYGGGAFSSTRPLLNSARSIRYRRQVFEPNATNPLAKKSIVDPNVIYLVPVPIGNVKDLTLRGLEILKRVDYIICASRRVTTFLLDTIDIDYNGRLINYVEKDSNHLKILELLQGGASMAFVTSVGMPCIGDIGAEFVRSMGREGVRISALPGADSVTAALAMSGVKQLDGSFFFGNHLSRLYSERMKQMTSAFSRDHPSVFFCRTERLISVLTEAAALNPGGKISVVQEISKVHEAVHYDTAKDLMDFYATTHNSQKLASKGECVIVFEGENIPGGIAPFQAMEASRGIESASTAAPRRDQTVEHSINLSPSSLSEKLKATRLIDAVDLERQGKVLGAIEAALVSAPASSSRSSAGTNLSDEGESSSSLSVHQLANNSSSTTTTRLEGASSGEHSVDEGHVITSAQIASGLSSRLVRRLVDAAGGFEAFVNHKQQRDSSNRSNTTTVIKETVPFAIPASGQNSAAIGHSAAPQSFQNSKRGSGNARAVASSTTEDRRLVMEAEIKRDLQAFRMLSKED